MNQYIKINLIIGFVWSYILIVWLLIGEITMDMSFGETLIIALAPSVISGVVTYVTVKKSQLKANTEELKKLSHYLGLREDQTLQNQIVGQFESISNDIGRNDNATLTKQHQNIEDCIEKSFKVIQTRYDEEDNTYRKFTTQQYELKRILDNFSRDYAEQIRRADELEKRNAELEKELLMYQTMEQELYNNVEIIDDEQEI